MMRMHKLFLAAAAAASLIAGGAQAANLVVNGDFESPSIGGAGFVNYSSAPSGFGWTVLNGDVDLVTYGGGFAFTTPAAGGGKQLLDLVGYTDGTILQGINTVAGQLYNISFDYSHNPYVADGTMDVVIFGGFGQIFGATVYDNNTSNAWSHYSGTFVGDYQSAALIFASQNTCCNGGIFLDNVSVSAAVPEPATWALMIGGFGLAGATLRRRRTIAAAA